MTEFIGGGRSVSELLERPQVRICRDLVKKYPDVDYFDDKDLIQTLEDVYVEKEQQFVIVIDEWDAVFREFPLDKEGR